MKPEHRQSRGRKSASVTGNATIRRKAEDTPAPVESSETSSVLEDQLWVQCENPDCLKWRLMSRDDAAGICEDQQWFCHMHPNVLFSSCKTPEEKYSSVHKLKKHGLTYKYSLLPEGSLVWAKLRGYCKWPSVICCQPRTSDYVILDNDGDPHSYHVEFLGTRHSIAWIYHTKIDAYGNLGKKEALETCSQPLSMVSMNRFKTRGKRRKRTSVTKKKISVQLSEQLQAAVNEADDLYELERKNRLKKCKIKCDENTTAHKEKALRNEKIQKKESRKGKNDKATKKRRGRQSKKYACDDSSTSVSGSQKQLLEHKLTNFASKEDRLLADIQGLQVLEQEFMADYAKFTKKNQSSITGPNWQGNSVSLFQLFMAVQEKGGFNAVCANMKWKAVVVDCCEVIPNKLSTSAASTAMTYYSRNLLPYEMHVKCSGSVHSSPQHVTAKVRKKKKARQNGSKPNLLKRKSQGKKEKICNDGPTGVVIEDDAIRELQEMEDLLNEMVGSEPSCRNDGLKGNARCEKQSSMNFCFNDDSQKPAKDMTQCTQILSQSQTNSKAGEGVPAIAYEDWFEGTSPSQVVPSVASLDTVQDHAMNMRDGDSVGSEEDLFAEIDRDEQLLQSLLDTT